MIGFGILLLGLIHYLLVRGSLPLYGFELGTKSAYLGFLPDWFVASFPSFAFVSGLILLEVSLEQLRSKRSCALTALKWVGIAIVCEYLQRYISTWGLAGVFDIQDVYASILGGFLALIFLNSGSFKAISMPQIFRGAPNKVLNLGVYGLAVLMLTATSRRDEKRIAQGPPRVCSEGYSIEVKPEDIKWTKPRPILDNGKIGLYNDTLLISEGSKGVHVVDNSDRKDPKAIGFIEIPGNNDIAVKDGMIYANAYYNLVIIDISKLPEIKVVKIIPEALGKNFSHCSAGFGQPILMNEVNVAKARSVTEEPVAVGEEPTLVAYRVTCLFHNDLDSCLVLTQDAAGLTLLSGCLSAAESDPDGKKSDEKTSEEEEKEKIYSCSFNVPLGSEVIGYSSACGEDNQGLTVATNQEYRIDFKSGFCGHIKHYNQNIPYFKDQYEAYKTEHVLVNDEASLAVFEPFFELKEEPETEEENEAKSDEKKDKEASTKEDKDA